MTPTKQPCCNKEEEERLSDTTPCRRTVQTLGVFLFCFSLAAGPGETVTEETVKKSRFIARCGHASTFEEAKLLLHRCSAIFTQADECSHALYVHRAGSLILPTPHTTAALRCSFFLFFVFPSFGWSACEIPRRCVLAFVSPRFILLKYSDARLFFVETPPTPIPPRRKLR